MSTPSKEDVLQFVQQVENDNVDRENRMLENEPVEPQFMFRVNGRSYPIDFGCLLRSDYKDFRKEFGVSLEQCFQITESTDTPTEATLDVVSWIFYRLVRQQNAQITQEDIDHHLSPRIVAQFLESIQEKKPETPSMQPSPIGAKSTTA